MTERAETATGELTPLVRAAWEAALEHDAFDADADFFAVGGNSLLAAKLMAGLSRQVGERLPLRLLFADPTVHGLERAIAKHIGSR